MIAKCFSEGFQGSFGGSEQQVLQEFGQRLEEVGRQSSAGSKILKMLLKTAICCLQLQTTGVDSFQQLLQESSENTTCATFVGRLAMRHGGGLMRAVVGAVFGENFTWNARNFSPAFQ